MSGNNIDEMSKAIWESRYERKSHFFELVRKLLEGAYVLGSTDAELIHGRTLDKLS